MSTQPYPYLQPLMPQIPASIPTAAPPPVPPPNQPHLVYNNAGPTPNTQGLYSSYSARIKYSEDNALLLPSSYTSGRKGRGQSGMFTDSDDEFEEMLEESDDDSNAESKQATTTAAGRLESEASLVEQNKNLPRYEHRRNGMAPATMDDLKRVSESNELLVPIRLDIDLDEVKLRDVFLWNMNEQYLTPEMFAELLCEDLRLDAYKFVKPISESIRAQVVDFEAINEYELPNGGDQLVEINLDLQIGKVNLRDKFEWNLNNIHTNAPELFARQLAAELGLGGEYIGIIAHGIRDQLFQHRKKIVEEFEGLDRREERIETAFRKVSDASKWAPKLEVLSNDELEKLLIAQERNIRRLRRETRFKRSTRRSTRG
ncbi:hypothetical protein BDF20DRAFT_897180 [Mycotypha africana]|uniref:uncharacterized protein n=1 Tax=Mycotypha africana TaxID=64632 RepID=UPI002301ADBC|nr:uncharacterized protein BDF20DRAFT_897180 [Mycotypha africana]KAI8968586.1 hypothetical protein BDF20DRAFT_897180 [Mycotypha africana]